MIKMYFGETVMGFEMSPAEYVLVKKSELTRDCLRSLMMLTAVHLTTTRLINYWGLLDFAQ